jgi:hypothetical protein
MRAHRFHDGNGAALCESVRQIAAEGIVPTHASSAYRRGMSRQVAEDKDEKRDFS